MKQEGTRIGEEAMELNTHVKGALLLTLWMLGVQELEVLNDQEGCWC